MNVNNDYSERPMAYEAYLNETESEDWTDEYMMERRDRLGW